MTLLVLGIILWIVVHLLKAAAPGVRQNLISGIGAGVYKAIVTLLILGSLALIIIGWRSSASTLELVYAPPVFLRHVTMLLMLIAIILFAASVVPSNINRLIRHPQLASVLVWAIAHLLANGENRSLILFGSLAVWAFLEIVLINRRDGVWAKPEATGWGRVLIPVIVGGVLYAALVYFHASIAGVPLLPSASA
jgi:uncharacterized membrane protein